MFVQEYLRSGKTISDLKDEFGIKSTYHPTESLVILSYDQIESRKTDVIARECRSLTLELNTYNVVARSFSRFFNWYEMTEEMASFDWSSSWASSKEDGSLVTLSHYNGWKIQTKNSFGDGECGFSGKSWSELFFGVIPLELIEKYCVYGHSYVFEFCGIHNKIVRTYKKNCAYLLTTFHNEDGEFSQEFSERLAGRLGCLRPEIYSFKNIDKVTKFLQVKGEEDATFEGVVLCDQNLNRWKVKNPLYLSLHAMRGEGDNLFNPKYLLPFVLQGEESELLIYFSECKDAFYEMKNKVDGEYATLVELWEQSKDITEQKSFALKIVPQTKFSSILFRVRKNEGTLRDIWMKSSNIILKVLYGK